MEIVSAVGSILGIFALLAFWAASFIILYHLSRFGVGVQPKRFAAVFLFGALVISSVAVASFSQIDLSTLPI